MAPHTHTRLIQVKTSAHKKGHLGLWGPPEAIPTGGNGKISTRPKAEQIEQILTPLDNPNLLLNGHVDWIDPCAIGIPEEAYDESHMDITKPTNQFLLKPLATSALPAKLACLRQMSSLRI